MKQCRGCSLFFIPERRDQDKCGNCERPKVPINPTPIDLWEQWS